MLNNRKNTSKLLLIISCGMLTSCSLFNTVQKSSDKTGTSSEDAQEIVQGRAENVTTTTAGSSVAKENKEGGKVVDYNTEVIEGNLAGGTYVRKILYRENEVNPKPQFPGGDAAYKKYLAQSVKYPQEALKKKIQGSVRIGFTVNPDGSIVNVKVERKVNPLLDNEALRVVKAMPKWKPGLYNGKAVPVKKSVPVNFRLTPQKR